MLHKYLIGDVLLVHKSLKLLIYFLFYKMYIT